MHRDKIAIIANSLSLGGAERVSLILTEWMASKGMHVYLFTLNKDREEGYELNPLINRVAINRDSKLSKYQIIKELRKNLKEYGINKILVMGVPLAVYAIPAKIGLRTSVIISERNDPANFKGKIATKIISRILMQLADGFVFQTEGAKQYYTKRIQAKSIVIPNPLLTDELPSVFNGARAKKIVTAGRLVKQKNHRNLIKAFKEVAKIYPEYTLIIYGNGHERAELENLVCDLELKDKVLLPGATKDLFAEIIDAELFVLSSDFEGMPNALIEAMALGIPCISTDCPPGGPRSLIENKKNGILVPVNDYLKLAESMKLLIKDKEIANRLSTEAVKIRTILSKDVICKKWVHYLLHNSTKRYKYGK